MYVFVKRVLLQKVHHLSVLGVYSYSQIIIVIQEFVQKFAFAHQKERK